MNKMSIPDTSRCGQWGRSLLTSVQSSPLAEMLRTREFFGGPLETSAFQLVGKENTD